jgi:asparagine synthase (glutamine-hydrolysing)
MAEALTHRGPDDGGFWVDGEIGIALAHRRLSILDLSPAGHQPMMSPCGRYVLTYNGEIYNHEELRKELTAAGGAFDWQGHSDTETLLAALRHWPLEVVLKKLNGMFAFALWNREDQTLTLARDRMGEKPIYYGVFGNSFIFGSELKALHAYPEWHGDVDRDSLALYMRHNYIPAPRSIYKGIFKLSPAHYVCIKDGGKQIGIPRCYWELAKIAQRGVESTVDDGRNLVEELETLLLDSVSLRMTADVPLGAFLSGGYDSTTIVALMQAKSTQPVRTFTIGFKEDDYDEAIHAKAVAKHLGTDHTELYLTAEDALAVIPEIPTIYDEPFSDSSQIPTFLVSQLARQDVTVSLSGDGGDELFYGYERYLVAERIWNKLAFLPVRSRRLAVNILNYVPGRLLERLMHLLPKRYHIKHFEDRLPKLLEILAQPSALSLYRELLSHSKNPTSLILGSSEPETILSRQDSLPALPTLREQMMFLDMMMYLPDDILTKVDRASMAVGLEARVPLLDHRILEFAWNAPTKYKYCNGQAKWLLRQVLYRHVPQELMDRPKMGFGVPIEHWLRDPLRDWAESLLNKERLTQEGYFNVALVRNMWEEHLSGKRRWHYYLWDVLMFQAWKESYL